MERVEIDAIERSIQPAEVMRPLTDALGLEDVAINYWELAPGDSFAFGYHTHDYQEEVFYVQEGTATFETEEGRIEVGPGEAIRFAPGEYQRGVNEGDERVIALALGAPKRYGEDEMVRECPDCGERTPNTIETVEGGAAKVTVCDRCGARTGRWT